MRVCKSQEALYSLTERQGKDVSLQGVPAADSDNINFIYFKVTIMKKVKNKIWKLPVF